MSLAGALGRLGREVRTSDASGTPAEPVFAAKTEPAAPPSRRVLSAEPGTYLVDSAELRERLALVSDEYGGSIELIVSSAHAMEPHVLTYEQRLKALRVSFKRRNATITEIAAIYASTAPAAAVTSDDTQEQRTMLRLIREAAGMGASDLKLIVNGDTCTVRYLVHGRGYNKHQLPAREGIELTRALYNSMLDQAGTQLNVLAEQDGQLRASFARAVGLAGARVATRPAKNRGFKLTMRLLPHDSDSGLTLERAGYSAAQVQDLLAMTERLQGVVILSGKTGSGKSTTLKLALEHLDERERGEVDIVTLEDPVEYDFRGVGIVQTPLIKDRDDPEDDRKAWPRGIANLMRHAPKIIMPGEIRDLASAIAAFDFAMSGHGVWTTFHAFSAEGILLRLDEWGLSRNLLLNPALVIGLVNQALVRVLCPQCKVPIKTRLGALPGAFAERVRTYTPVDGVYMQGPGCEACGQRGTRGRLIASEVIVPTEALMRAYAEHGALAARRFWARELGGVTKAAHVRTHIAAGLVDPAHAERDVDHLDADYRLLGVPT